MSRTHPLACLVGLALLAGCGGASVVDGGTPVVDSGRPRPDAGVARQLASFTVTAASPTVDVGQSVALTAAGTWADDGSAAQLTLVVWESSDNKVASVDGAGVVTGLKAGVTVITAGKLGKKASVPITVNPQNNLPVFTDNFINGEEFLPFDAANAAEWANRVGRDTTEKRTGAASLKITFGPGAGTYLGGVFKVPTPKDLSPFTALTFWAKGSAAATLDVVGFGNSIANTDFSVERTNLPITTTWTRFVLPIPEQSLVGSMDGLFHFADDVGTPYALFIDDLQYEKLDVGAASPTMTAQTAQLELGTKVTPAGRGVGYAGAAGTFRVNTAARYFTYSSSAPAVASVNVVGEVSSVMPGTATISAKLGALDVAGQLNLTVVPSTGPSTAAPTPTLPASDVIALFSDAYPERPVDTWVTSWSPGSNQLSDLDIGGNKLKKYTPQTFLGIEFAGTKAIDATAMTHFHLDVWTRNAPELRVKLVNWASNGQFNNGVGVTAGELNVASFGALTPQQWVSYDIPLSAFASAQPPLGPLSARSFLAQLILITPQNGSVFVDNIYFHK